MPERDYAGMVDLANELSDAEQAEIARERAHLRRFRSIKSTGGPSRMPARGPELSPQAAELARGMVIPQTPLDYGIAAATAPVSWPIRLGAMAAGAALDPDPAQAGALAAARRLFFPVGKRPEAITAVNLRTMPYDEAVRIARSERHLIPSPGGGMVGAPSWVKNQRDLDKMRADFDAAVEGGAPGGKWYSEGQKGNVEIAGTDPQRLRQVARGEALFSSQANPDTNLGFFLNAWNASQAGKPLSKVRTGQQAETFNEAMATGQDIKLGRKTSVYGGHLDPTVGDPNTGTNDIWHARALGYVDDKGKPWDKALTPQQHAFMDAETILAVQRANAKKLLGRSDWTPGEVQAAAWVQKKGADLATKRFGGDMARGIAEASKGYPQFFDKYTGFGTYEAIPGAMTSHLPGLPSASQAERSAFSADPRSSWMDPQRRDILYQARGMLQRPTLEATGMYTPPGGVTEFNPLFVPRPMVGLTGRSGARTVDPASRQMLDEVEAARAYADAQGAGAWSKPIYGNRAATSTSVLLDPTERARRVAEIQQLKDIGSKLGIPDVVDYGRSAIVTNFGGDVSPRALGTALRKGGAAELEAATPGASAQRVQLDSGYIPMFEKGEGVGSGAVTRELQGRLSPQAIAAFDASPEVRRAVLDRLERDAEYASRTGQPVREDVQLARKIISEEGFAGLFQALARGAPLPAFLTPLAMDAMRSQPSPE